MTTLECKDCKVIIQDFETSGMSSREPGTIYSRATQELVYRVIACREHTEFFFADSAIPYSDDADSPSVSGGDGPSERDEYITQEVEDRTPPRITLNITSPRKDSSAARLAVDAAVYRRMRNDSHLG